MHLTAVLFLRDGWGGGPLNRCQPFSCLGDNWEVVGQVVKRVATDDRLGSTRRLFSTIFKMVDRLRHISVPKFPHLKQGNSIWFFYDSTWWRVNWINTCKTLEQNLVFFSYKSSWSRYSQFHKWRWSSIHSFKEKVKRVLDSGMTRAALPFLPGQTGCRAREGGLSQGDGAGALWAAGAVTAPMCTLRAVARDSQEGVCPREKGPHTNGSPGCHCTCSCVSRCTKWPCYEGLLADGSCFPILYGRGILATLDWVSSSNFQQTGGEKGPLKPP